MTDAPDVDERNTNPSGLPVVRDPEPVDEKHHEEGHVDPDDAVVESPS